jgi:KDO2-lipid IV(A) lauroyltransferase
MAKPRNKVIDYVVYVAARVAAAVLHALPLEATYRVARAAAWLICRFDRVHWDRAVGHLERSFADWPAERVARVARASVRSMISMFLEALWTPRLIQPHRWRRHVRLRHMPGVIRLMVERKQPAIMITGHFGNWEVVGYTMAAVGLPSYTVARHIDNPHIDRFVFGVREEAGQRMIYKKGAARQVAEAMHSRAVVCFVGDQDAGRKGIYVDFFGRKASTFKSIALMAMEYQTPLVVAGCRRLDHAFRFEIFIQRVIDPREWRSRDDPLEWITREYTAALEQMVRSCPEQYFWVHRRWKHRPAGETRPADGIA